MSLACRVSSPPGHSSHVQLDTEVLDTDQLDEFEAKVGVEEVLEVSEVSAMQDVVNSNHFGRLKRKE